MAVPTWRWVANMIPNRAIARPDVDDDWDDGHALERVMYYAYVIGWLGIALLVMGWDRLRRQ